MILPFLVPVLLFGLAAVAIPPLIHLLNRRRFDVVDWGAMQFLQLSETTRRRLLIEEVLLMLLRMGLIAVMVLALAGPFIDLSWFAGLIDTSRLASQGARPNRDVVLVFDGSYSMGYTDAATNASAHEAAKEWATAFINDLSPGDSVAILQAKQQVVPVLPEPSHDLERVREAIRKLPSPAGGCDWSQAVQDADRILKEKSTRLERDVILLSDGQKRGWADPDSLLRWDLLAPRLRAASGNQPRVWVVNVDPRRPKDPSNWSLAPIRASRAVASVNQTITFKTALELNGQNTYEPPYRLRLEIDGRPAADLKAPTKAKLEKGQVPLSFTHKFDTVGSHLVSVIVEPDPPPEKRPEGYKVRDQLPGDNRQDFALEVLKALPVLLVDGDERLDPKSRATDFLRNALSPKDPAPSVLARVVPIQDFKPALLTRDLVHEQPGSRPRVLVLCNVAQLKPEQREAVNRFLADGGGVLVTLGDRVDARHYNEHLFRGGQGWLPARLDEIKGDESAPANAARPLPATFYHPALSLFRDMPAAGLAVAQFPRWWRVDTPARNSSAVAVALLSNKENDPFLVERPYGAGRVLLCTVPLDNSWRTNLTRLEAFLPLAHELIYYLAGARSAEHNLRPGQPIRHRPADDAQTGTATLRLPQGDPKPLPLTSAPLLYEGTRETGVYRLQLPDGHTVYYVVQPDHQESDLTAYDKKDAQQVKKLMASWFKLTERSLRALRDEGVPEEVVARLEKIRDEGHPTESAFLEAAGKVLSKPQLETHQAALVDQAAEPIIYVNDREEIVRALTAPDQRQELWKWFLLGVIVLLCSEVWLTRRIVKNR